VRYGVSRGTSKKSRQLITPGNGGRVGGILLTASGPRMGMITTRLLTSAVGEMRIPESMIARRVAACARGIAGRSFPMADVRRFVHCLCRWSCRSPSWHSLSLRLVNIIHGSIENDSATRLEEPRKRWHVSSPRPRRKATLVERERGRPSGGRWKTCR
jgi:hypothetical protein